MGYRAALEILIKDYAVKFTDESKDKIAGYTLNDAIVRKHSINSKLIFKSLLAG